MKVNSFKAYCLLSLLLFLFSCCTHKSENNSITHIDIEGRINKFHKIYLSEYADSIWYVPLESRLDHPISWNSTLLFAVSGDFIFDSNVSECFLYDKNGRFVREIGKQGRGPGEYQGISGISLIEDKIYMHDFYTDDLIEYNIDGTFLKRYKSGYTADEKYRLEYRETIMLNDSLIFGNIENRLGNEEFKALIIDKQGQIKYSYKNYIKFPLATGVRDVRVPGKAIIYNIGDKVLFKEFLNDTLFVLDKNYRLKPQYVFDFGKYKQPLSERGKKWDFDKLNSYINLIEVFDLGDYSILECDFKNYFPAKRLTPQIVRLPGHDDIIVVYNTTIAFVSTPFSLQSKSGHFFLIFCFQKLHWTQIA